MRAIVLARVVGCVSLFVFAACSGGGERPPSEVLVAPANDAGASGKVTVTGFDADGIKFGDDGLVNCGAQAPDKVITLTNPTSDVINFTVRLSSGKDSFTLNPAEGGGVPAKGSTTIQVIPKPIPQKSDVTPDLYAGTLEITTADDPTPKVVRLHQTARGAIINSTVTADIDFGDVRIGKVGSQLFTFTNLGNVEAAANFTLGSQIFKVDGGQAAAAKIAPGEAVSKTITLTPTGTDIYTDALAITYSGGTVHCQDPPDSIKVKGKGSTAVGVSPGVLNFGQVDCGNVPAAPQQITVESSVAMHFTPNLGKLAASPYTLQDAANNTITLGTAITLAADSTYVIKVVPKAPIQPQDTTPNGLGDTLTITSDVVGDSPHTVTLNETARGAILQFAPSDTLSEQGNMGGLVKTKPFTLKNVGNAPAPYVITVTPASNFSSNLKTGTAAVGDTAGVMSITLPGAGQVSGSMSITSGGVLCKDLPGSVALLATFQ